MSEKVVKLLGPIRKINNETPTKEDLDKIDAILYKNGYEFSGELKITEIEKMNDN